MPSKPTPAPAATPQPDPDYDPEAIFRFDGPIHPEFITDAVHTMMRTLPLDAQEVLLYANRRRFAALGSVAAMHPRDEIEMMLATQAVSAYHAAASGWRLGMNHHQPNGDSTRHAAMAASAVRTFDSLLKALERRQARPLAIPVGRPPNRHWPQQDLALFVEAWADRCRGDEASPPQEHEVVWNDKALSIATELRRRDPGDREDDIEAILPGGIIPEDPTPEQQIFIGRRIGLAFRRMQEDNKRRGIDEPAELPVVRAGEQVP